MVYIFEALVPVSISIGKGHCFLMGAVKSLQGSTQIH